MPTRELTVIGGHPTGPATTVRKDRWWVSPSVTVFALTAFSIYVMWAAFQGANYYANPYLSPLYSPVLFTDMSAAGSAPLSPSGSG